MLPALLGLMLAVDTGAVLHLIGYLPSAHACPVADTYALTGRHVAENLETGELRRYRFSTDDGLEGVVEPVAVLSETDLALMKVMTPDVKLRAYPVAAHRPQVGDQVAIAGYDWRDQKRAFATRTWDGEVLRIVAGNIVYKNPGEGGSSGSCVWNEQGEVVGIGVGFHSLSDQRAAGLATAIWGLWGETIMGAIRKDQGQEPSAADTAADTGFLRLLSLAPGAPTEPHY